MVLGKRITSLWRALDCQHIVLSMFRSCRRTQSNTTAYISTNIGYFKRELPEIQPTGKPTYGIMRVGPNVGPTYIQPCSLKPIDL